MEQEIKKEESLLKKITTAAGYVVVGFCALILSFVLIAVAAFIILDIVILVLFGLVVIAFGIILVGIGISKIFVMPRGAVTSIGLGMLLAGAGGMYETAVVWFMINVAPKIWDKLKTGIRKGQKKEEKHEEVA